MEEATALVPRSSTDGPCAEANIRARHRRRALRDLDVARTAAHGSPPFANRSSTRAAVGPTVEIQRLVAASLAHAKNDDEACASCAGADLASTSIRGARHVHTRAPRRALPPRQTR
jgi:hypothetical protein